VSLPAFAAPTAVASQFFSFAQIPRC
jgi:hypothetical protein